MSDLTATSSWCCRCEGGCEKEREPGSYLCVTCQNEGCEPHRSDLMADLELSIERARAARLNGRSTDHLRTTCYRCAAPGVRPYDPEVDTQLCRACNGSTGGAG